MRAMILAAGRGERMRPLSDKTPKPLLSVAQKPLIIWHIEKLAKNGFKEIVINIAHLGDMIKETLGDGSRWGVNLIYSDESKSGALECAGAIIKVLKYFRNETFLVVNGDIFCSYEFDSNFDLEDKLAHLILVSNPEHNRDGDFGLVDSLAINEAQKRYTFSGIGYYHPKLFVELRVEKIPLAPILREMVSAKMISAELFRGEWSDIGTPQRLQKANTQRGE